MNKHYEEALKIAFEMEQDTNPWLDIKQITMLRFQVRKGRRAQLDKMFDDILQQLSDYRQRQLEYQSLNLIKDNDNDHNS